MKLPNSPHTHNIILYIALGLIFQVLNLVIIFLSLYLSLWYIWENFKIIKKQLRSIKNNLNILMSYNTNEGYGAIDRYTELAKNLLKVNNNKIFYISPHGYNRYKNNNFIHFGYKK